MFTINLLGIKVAYHNYIEAKTLFHTQVLAAELFVRKSVTPNLKRAQIICYITPI
jgi:hypothetical protein